MKLPMPQYIVFYNGQAIDAAITYCLDNDMLTDVLLKNRSEVSHMLLTEFNEKKFAKTMWKEGHESAFSEGHKFGYSEVLTIMDEILLGIQYFCII